MRRPSAAGLGFKMKNIELVGEYTYNRFDTANLPPDDGTHDLQLGLSSSSGWRFSFGR